MDDKTSHPLVAELTKELGLPVTPLPAKRENRQLYQGGALSEDPQATQYYKQSGALFNDKPPNLQILHERPEHRLIVYLKAQGLTNKEIAERTNYGYQWVCQIVRQPWFRQRFIEECQHTGRDAIKVFLEGEVMPSLETIRAIRDNADAKSSDRLNASNALLDRFLGKPTQRTEVENTSKGLDDAKQEVEDLERQVAELRKQNGLEESQPAQN